MNTMNFAEQLTTEQIAEIFNKCNLQLFYVQDQFGNILPPVRKQKNNLIVFAIDKDKLNLVNQLNAKLAEILPIMPLCSGDYTYSTQTKMFFLNNFSCTQVFALIKDDETNIKLTKALQDMLLNQFKDAYFIALNEYQHFVDNEAKKEQKDETKKDL